MNRAPLALALALAGCAQITPLRPPASEPPAPAPFVCDDEAARPESESLTWKRVEPLTRDLEIALELPSDALCDEVGQLDCADVHRVALGGNDAVGAAQYRPVAEPLATTPTAIDRLVISACENAVARDAAEAPRVFTELPPTDDAVDAGDPRIAAQLAALYRRLLARDAEAEELAILAALATDDAGAARTARELDVLACFAIGTTAEMVLF